MHDASKQAWVARWTKNERTDHACERERREKRDGRSEKRIETNRALSVSCGHSECKREANNFCKAKYR